MAHALPILTCLWAKGELNGPFAQHGYRQLSSTGIGCTVQGTSTSQLLGPCCLTPSASVAQGVLALAHWGT